MDAEAIALVSCCGFSRCEEETLCPIR
jgi:hypothetical protein